MKHESISYSCEKWLTAARLRDIARCAQRPRTGCLLTLLCALLTPTFVSPKTSEPQWPPRSELRPKETSQCLIVTLQNQVKCRKVVLGTFPTNPNWIRTVFPRGVTLPVVIEPPKEKR